MKAPTPQAVAEPAPARRDMIAFRIGEQEFCMDIGFVREIRGWTEATTLPHVPAYVKGVINLRGAVVPIIDLAARLGLAPIEPGPRHVIIIVSEGERLTGLLVSAVSDLLGAGAGEVLSVPELGEAGASFLSGVVHRERGLLRLINVPAILRLDRQASEPRCPG